MKFDYCIGNPPYNELDGSGGGDDSALPIYNKFIESVNNTNVDKFSFIIPAKWMVGGRGLQKFRTFMKNNNHIKVIVDYENAKDCFSNVNLDGGVCYFLIDKSYNGPTKYIYIKDKQQSEKYRYLFNDFSDFVIRDNSVIGLLEKTNKEITFKTIVSSTKPFGIRGFLFNEPNRYPEANLQEKPQEDYLKIYGVKGIKGGAKRVFGFINPITVTNNKEAISKYKILFSATYSTNAMNFPQPILAKPNEICTETFLMIGPFDSEIERDNCYKYMNTSFFKTLLFLGKGTMHVNKDVFSFIPMEDFSKKSDIDWSCSIIEINKQLYKKYNLSNEDINFIETKVKEME